MSLAFSRKARNAATKPLPVLFSWFSAVSRTPKAEDIVTINIAGKSALGDYMVVVSGRSSRHVMAIADHLITDLKDGGQGNAPR